ncbi:hypothetical protein Q2T42_30945 [Leptolyngbya boryana CZ1]|uniref:Uncharacterized protein n=1 Tax=Leptolyngbya boryana CZ1 TaxID=3060204 RepID=A0AA97ANX5_LEPBY|nr:hypothetical protein [Leptolyngbya boryana]WNZ46208.1 hypothetical protein Q2T42_30945 [Leptolyngbya boryana CZ1]
MAKSRQSSFRRILLWRLLLLSIPVLLTGEVVAYKKAKSGLLQTARYTLTARCPQSRRTTNFDRHCDRISL